MLKTSPHPAWFLTTVLEAKSVTVESKPSVGSSDMVRGSGSLPSSSVLSCLPPQGLNVNPKWATYTFTTETPGTGLGEPWKPKQRKAGETETAARVETQPSHDNQARPLPGQQGRSFPELGHLLLLLLLLGACAQFSSEACGLGVLGTQAASAFAKPLPLVEPAAHPPPSLYYTSANGGCWA